MKPSGNEIPDFKSLGLSDCICHALSSIGYGPPTPIQRATIPHGLQQKSIIAQAKAGTGKTLAFATVALEIAASQNDEQISGLILLPTREIAIQVFDVMFQISEKILKQTRKEIRIGLCIGGLPIEDDRNFLRQNGHIVVGTMGRILALLNEKSLDLTGLKILVLDEADKLSKKENAACFANILKFIPEEAIQKLAFSATYTSAETEKLSAIMKNPEVIRIDQEAGHPEAPDKLKRRKEQAQNRNTEEKEEGELNAGQNALENFAGASPTKKIKAEPQSLECSQEEFSMNLRNLSQFYFNIDEELDATKSRASVHEAKFEKILELLKAIEFSQAIIFYNDKARGEEMVNDLKAEGLNVLFMHGDMTQAERIKVMNRLKIKKASIILATDLLARGIDIEDISLVINYDVPRSTETYFHRIGRTGRFGRFGVSILMLTAKEKQAFIDENQIFIDIERLPSSWQAVNTRLREQNDSKLKAPAKKPTSYGKESKISSWKPLEHQFFDEKKFQFFETEDNVPLTRGELVESVQEQTRGKKDDNRIKSKGDAACIKEEEDEEDYYAFLDEEEDGEISNQVDIADTKEDHQISPEATGHSHGLVSGNELQFLSCAVCYEFLRKSEQLLGRKFRILEYFDVPQERL